MKNSDSCDDQDVALKSFFLGPQSENRTWLRQWLLTLFEHWFDWRRDLFPEDGAAISVADQRSEGFRKRLFLVQDHISDLTKRFEEEVPKFSPRYIGHMFSEISLPALLGHVIALIHNPNNVSGEASRVGLSVEREAIELMMTMIGMDQAVGTGHFTSGGTVANFEALRRARYRIDQWTALGAHACLDGEFEGTLFEVAHMGWQKFDLISKKLQYPDCSKFSQLKNNPFDFALTLKEKLAWEYRGPVLLVPGNKHYSWEKGVRLLGLGDESLWTVELDENGKLCVPSLRAMIEKAKNESRPVLGVVSVGGTTEMGEVDPIDEVCALLDEYEKNGIHIWHHVDAAYGGFFCTMVRGKRDLGLKPKVAAALNAIERANSVTIDPHKLGYVPFASGTFICKMKREYVVSTSHAPYIVFDQKDEGVYSLEGSRSAGGAVATWLTGKCIGFNQDGYGLIISKTVEARKVLEEALKKEIPDLIYPHVHETNIICFCVAKKGESLSNVNKRSSTIYDAFSTTGDGPYFVSRTMIRRSDYARLLKKSIESFSGVEDADHLTLIRLTIMNPFFITKETKTNFVSDFSKELSAVVKKTL